MKKKNENYLWIQNQTTSDVSLADLGVKVPTNSTINIYQSNPYLTTEQVRDSLKNGSLARRISSDVLRVVKREVHEIPETLKNVMTSKETVTARRTKSSVIIETKEDEPEEMESFDFADYGISDLGPVMQERDGAAVVVNAQQDSLEEPEGVKLEPVLEKSAQNNAQVVMKEMQEKMSSPVGKLAPTSVATKSQPFVVVQDGSKEEMQEKLPEDECEVEKAEETELKAEAVEPDFDAKAAVKTEDGAVIMKIKQTEE